MDCFINVHINVIGKVQNTFLCKGSCDKGQMREWRRDESLDYLYWGT